MINRLPGDRETLLRHCFLSIPFALFVYLTIEYVTIFSVSQLQSSSGVFFTPDCSLFVIPTQQKPHSRIEHKTTAQRSQTLCLAPGTSHFVTRWRRHSGATSENVALHFCLLYVKSRRLLESRQVIKYNMARRLHNQ